MQGVFRVTGLETEVASEGVTVTVRSGLVALQMYFTHGEYRRNLEHSIREYNAYCDARPIGVVLPFQCGSG